MYGSLNTNEYEDGQHLWYETCFGNGKFIVVIDKQKRYNLRSIRETSKPNLSEYIMIQCIDETEVFPISEETHPEKYFKEGIRV